MNNFYQSNPASIFNVEKGMLSMYQASKVYAPDRQGGRLIDNADHTDVTHCTLNSESNDILLNSEPVEHLDLINFKAQPCKLQTQHNHKHCHFYHNVKDRKRMGNFYSAELCDFIENHEQPCPYGEACQKAHNRVEQLYKPEKYKTKFCTFYPFHLNQCEYGQYCSFAHSEEDILSELIHNLEFDDDFFMFYYKTVWCPFNLTQHDKAQCVYAHNWQDFRRKPSAYAYAPIPCQNWNTNNFIIEYETGCIDGFICAKCHGWKELEFHPYVYKTKECTNTNTCKRVDCPGFHTQKEKKIIQEKILKRVFKYVPRNRITRNVFKLRGSSLDSILKKDISSNNLCQEFKKLNINHCSKEKKKLRLNS